MEPESTKWVVQKVSADDPGSMMVEWDTFNVGILEGANFRTIYSCWSEEDANFLLTALQWYTSFKEGNIIGVESGKATPPSKKPRRKVKNG